MPPDGNHCPASTAALTRSKTSGCRSWSQAYCWALVAVNRKSGYSAASATTFEKVRATFRTVSRTGHSQAESIWACPIAVTFSADAIAGASKTGASAVRARPAEPGTSCRSSTSSARSRPLTITARRVLFSGRFRARSHSTSRSWNRPHSCSSRTCSWAERNSYTRSCGAVRRSPRTVGLQPSANRSGFAAASTKNSRGVPGTACPAMTAERFRELTALITCRPESNSSPSHWPPGQASANPRSTVRRSRCPSAVVGTFPDSRNHQVLHAAPQ